MRVVSGGLVLDGGGEFSFRFCFFSYSLSSLYSTFTLSLLLWRRVCMEIH
jgi:hypothetical protein